MKKHLLLGISFGISVFAFGQNTTTLPNGLVVPKINAAAAKLAKPYEKNQMLGGNSFESMVNSLTPNPHQNQAKVATLTNIGATDYQLQTNSSICNRIIHSSDGTISATWTMSHEAGSTTWTDRGTGYNYYDGTNWGTAPATRIEGVRTGFTNVGVTSTGAEVIVCHETAVPAIRMDNRAVKGTGAWTETDIPNLPDTWARMSVGGSNGHTIHVISSSGLGGGTAMITYHGQVGSVNYSRSLDGGLTWDIQRYIIPLIDSSHYLGFGGDSYSIDARGDTVAIVLGGFDVDVILLKSIDNGTTWTKTIVKQFPIPMFDGTTMYTDSLDPTNAAGAVKMETNDASVEVLLDNNGKAHVWYGRMVVFDSIPATGTQGLSYFPYTQGLMYWNENMGSSAPVMITSVLDLAYAGHPADGILNVDFDNSGAGLLGMGTFQVSLTSHPSAGIDASGVLFLTYSGIFEGLNDQGTLVPGAGSANPGKSLRHVYAMRSDDGGANWCVPHDISDPDIESGTYDYLEGVYGSIAKHVQGGFVDLVAQNDFSAGHGVSTTTSPDVQTGSASIDYYKIPVTDLNLNCDVGVHNKPSAFNAINIYPNPASNSVNVKFNVNKTTKAVVKIYNIMGKEVAMFDNQSIANGTVLNITLANYNSGIYLINTIVDGKTYSQKLIVQ